jgi:DNA processing protein
MTLVHLTPLDPRYPSRLRQIVHPPASLTASGGSLEAERTVAIVGSRSATPGAARFAAELAAILASAGVVVVSGGAVGVDASAHRGAMNANGRTWVIAGTGHEHCYPAENADLFDEVADGPDRRANRGGFTERNGYLVALSDTIVVVQAHEQSGALNAAQHAKRQRKPLWVVAAAPWLRRFAGSARLLAEGATPLFALDPFLESLGLTRDEVTEPTVAEEPKFAAGKRTRSGLERGNRHDSHTVASALPQAPIVRPLPPLSDQESAALRVTGPKPRHADAIAEDAGLSPQATAAALLTLALENVLVEGPPGFFRRRDAYNR